MFAAHAVEGVGGSGGTDGAARACTGTVGASWALQLDTEVGAVLVGSVHGGLVAGGEGEVVVVVGVRVDVWWMCAGAAEGKELDGCLVEVSEMEVGDRQHCNGLADKNDNQ